MDGHTGMISQPPQKAIWAPAIIDELRIFKLVNFGAREHLARKGKSTDQQIRR